MTRLSLTDIRERIKHLDSEPNKQLILRGIDRTTLVVSHSRSVDDDGREYIRHALSLAVNNSDGVHYFDGTLDEILALISVHRRIRHKKELLSEVIVCQKAKLLV
jgi:hypothetical protein